MSALKEYQNKCREETKTRILAALQGAGWIRYQNLKEKAELAKSTLSKYLKELVEEKILERRRELKSGEWPIPVSYRIAKKEESFVKAQVERYHAINYINKMEKLVHRSKQDKKSSISVFMSPVEKDYRRLAQIMVDSIAGGYVRFVGLAGKGLRPGQKLAIVITVEG